MLYKSKKRKAGSGQLLTLSIVSACLLMAACSNDNDNVSVDDQVMSLVKAAGITGDPSTGRTLPSINDPKAQLGKKLFFTKGLGGNEDSACVTCHHPSLGGGDNLSLSIGVNAEAANLLGPGRFHDEIKAADDNDSEWDGGPTVPRNAPTTFNIAMWDQVLFHDGRVESIAKTPGANGDDGSGIRTPDSAFDVADPNAGTTLAAAQSRFPVTSPEEMRGFANLVPDHNAADRVAIEDKLKADDDWVAEFDAVFGNGTTITYMLIADAIGEYERSQVFVNTPWKAYVEGDTAAISEAAKRGAVMFFDSIEDGGANCTSCHSSDFFTDEQFHVMATPQVGRGKGDDNGALPNDDFGRSRESGVMADKYKFRTPTLLNVEVTGPWSHAGAYTTLENMVRHMLNPAAAVASYDYSQLNPTIQAEHMLTNTQFALEQLEANRSNNVADVHRNVTFIEDDITDLVEFLKTLTDPCVKDRACLAPWIPDASDSNPDGLRLNAIDNTGAFL